MAKLLELISLPSLSYIQVLSQCITIITSLCEGDKNIQNDFNILGGIDIILNRLFFLIKNPQSLLYVGNINETALVSVPEHRIFGYLDSMLNLLILVMKPVSIDSIRFKGISHL